MCVHTSSLERPNVARLVIEHVDLRSSDAKFLCHPSSFPGLAASVATEDVLRHWNVWSRTMMRTDPSDMTICAAPGVPYILPEVRQSDLTPSVGIVMATNDFVPWACPRVLLTACECPINVKDAQAISGPSAGLTML